METAEQADSAASDDLGQATNFEPNRERTQECGAGGDDQSAANQDTVTVNPVGNEETITAQLTNGVSAAMSTHDLNMEDNSQILNEDIETANADEMVTSSSGETNAAVPFAEGEQHAAQLPEQMRVLEQMEVPEYLSVSEHSDDDEVGAEAGPFDQLNYAHDVPTGSADLVSALNLSPEDGAILRFDPAPLIEPLLVDDEMGEIQPGNRVVVEEDGDADDEAELEAPANDANATGANRDDNMRQAFRELLLQNRHGVSYRDNFMQRLRSAFFAMEHRGRNRRAAEQNEENEDTEPVAESEPEPEPENPVCFDTNLPAEHSYLGTNMNRVSGVNYLEVGQYYTMMLFMHQHILFPGEVLPFMISGTIMESDIDAQNGLLFGVCFPVLCSNDSDDNFYGVTCQIYEKGSDSRGNTLIKSRALQRFVVKGDKINGPLQFIAAHPQLKCRGNIKILPEIYLPEPLNCINMGSMNRFRDNKSMREMYRRYQAVGTPWPPHIYNDYSISEVIEKARTQLAQHKIDTMPSEPIQLSFWLVRNLHLSDNLMKEIFTTDSVNKRLKLISNTFTEESLFTCRYCGNRIANCRQLFAMSKHGVQTQYCNSAGYIHETNTVYQLLPDAVTYSGEPSSEFSWFPGYEWHIIVCKSCSRHIGWKFKGLEPNLVPKQFFGISSSSVRISSPRQPSDNTPFLQSLMRIARELQ